MRGTERGVGELGQVTGSRGSEGRRCRGKTGIAVGKEKGIMEGRASRRGGEEIDSRGREGK